MAVNNDKPVEFEAEEELASVVEDIEIVEEDIPDGERYPNTKKWSDQQKADYVEKNKSFIRSIVSRIRNIPDAALSQDDLFQEAQVAFWLALDTYNPKKKVLFTTYAHKCMRNAVNEKLRATTASKRTPTSPTIPFDSGYSESGEEFMGGDNMEIPMSSIAWQELPVEEQCVRNEVLDYVYDLLKKQFTPEEQRVFLALARKQATQNELAREMKCSQAKISMMYKFVRIRILYELQEAGFAEMP